MKNIASLGVAWSGFIAGLVVNHLSLVVSVAAGMAAIAASVYSILLNRDKRRRGEAHDEALCRACHQNPGSVECPYPAHARPDDCALKE